MLIIILKAILFLAIIGLLIFYSEVTAYMFKRFKTTSEKFKLIVVWFFLSLFLGFGFLYPFLFLLIHI